MKKQPSRDSLTADDRHLWKRVAETTRPLSLQRGAFLKDEMARLMAEGSHAKLPVKPGSSSKSLIFSAQQPSSKLVPKAKAESHPLESRLVKNIAKGRRQIDGRIDLHGMTQDRARHALFDFLQLSQQADYRIVLVITGKGNEGRGVLRRMVPQWLALPAFLPLVNGYREAHTGHGGEGALYVRLRRRRS